MVTAETYPDADIVLVDGARWIRYRADQILDPSIIEPSRYRELLDLYREMIDRKFKLYLLRRIPGEDRSVDL